MGPATGCLLILSWMAQAPAGPAVPASAPASQQVLRPIESLTELDGAYLEVLATAEGLRKTQRCGVADQLLLQSEGSALNMRWSGSPSARSYPAPRLERGVVILRERRRTVEIARVQGDLLRIRYLRSDGKRRDYLYGRVERVQALPMIVVEDEGCEY